MSEVRYLGTTDDFTTCECCGKKNLKCTVAISVDGGEAMYFGSDCAARALGRSAKEIRSESRKADRAREEQARIEREATARAASAPWFSFLAAHGKGDNTFTRIESLGGYATAREAFRKSQGTP